MPILPTSDNLGQRPLPNAPVLQSQVVSVDLSQSAKAYERLGQDLMRFGVGMAQYQHTKDRAAFVDAKSAFLRKSVEKQAELENDPDFSTYQQRYREAMGEAKKEAFETLGKSNPFGTGAFGNQYANDLQADLDLHEAQGLARVGEIASRKEGDFERASLDNLLIENNKALLQTSDEAARSELMFATNEAIDLRAERGFISQEAAAKLKQNFAENYATQRVALLPTNQQMQLIKPTRGKNGEISFPQTGNWTDALSNETKIKIYGNAQAQIKTQINDEVNDVNQAAKLGLQIPKEKIQSLAARAYSVGLNNVAQNLNKYAAVQEEADKFAALSLTQQQTTLSNLKTSIEAGNLKDVDKYAAFGNILETKTKLLKEDPYSYYAARGIISQPQPLDVTNPISVAQNLEARRVENQKVKQIEGQNFEMPILTKQEIDQLKSINEKGSADQVGTILYNIGNNLSSTERQTLARQLAKEQSPTLAVAMALNNPKDSIDIIAGSKMKGEVSSSKLRTELASKLSGLVFDPETNEMYISAINDAYKKMAFDDGNVEKDVDLDLLDKTIKKVVGNPIKISPAGKVSKVFTYRDDSGNLVSENDLEDTFTSINDDVLRNLKGSLPIVPGSGDVLSAKEMLKHTRMVSYGNGQYVPVYEGVGYLVDRNGEKYIIDAKKVKDLTGNAPANSTGRIQTRPSQSIFGFN